MLALADDTVLTAQPAIYMKEIRMQEEYSKAEKIKLFIKAFSEFLRRPKTVFDIKDRLKLILLLLLMMAVLESIIWYAEN